MHPEVKQSKPGDCPECGMALEPQTISLQEEKNIELINMTKRFWISLILLIPLIFITISLSIPAISIRNIISFKTVQWLEFIISTPVVLWAGWPFFIRGYNSIKYRSLNMFTLISIGVAVAYFYSFIAVIIPWIFPSSFRDKSGQVATYFESAAFIVTLVLLGQVLELKARNKTSQAIKLLLEMEPKTARVIKDGKETDIPLDEVAAGDLLRVRPGEKVPADGIIIEGSTSIDESMITGESIPVEKYPGSQVIGGTLNTTGSLIMKAEKVGSDTLLSKIIQMVSQAQRSRAPIQKLADVVSGYFVQIVIAVSILTFIIWALFGPQPRMALAIVNAVAVLLIACPCALGLATPISIMVATGKGATEGILFKNAETIELMKKIDTLVVDKTGTITKGKPQLIEVIPEKGFDEKEILYFAVSMEKGSEHPLAMAIVSKATEQEINPGKVEEFKSIQGKGIIGKIEAHNVVLGNNLLFSDFKINHNNTNLESENKRKEGKIVVFLAIDGKIAGQLVVADPIKDTAFSAIKQIHKEGIQVIMLTGDNQTTAEAISKQIGIDKVISEVLPDQKALIIKKLQEEKKIVAMAGDGINDAPALTQANVGIAMGSGTDIAIESAGITLVKGDLNGILKAIRLSRATMQNIKQNLFFAFIYNTIGIPIAAGILYPFFGILLSPVIAAAAMSFSSISVISNALRLRKTK
jgi:Cu+-exporting ATPase